MSKARLHDLTLQLHHQTPDAILVSDDGDRDKAKWLPKSQIEYTEKEKGIVEVTMPEWLAVDKGFL